MKAYSLDLRERIVAAVDAGEYTQAEVAVQYQVSLSFVEKLVQRWHKTGTCAALPHAGGRQRSLQAEAVRLRAAVAQQPDVTLQELCAGLAEQAGPRASPSMMCRELKYLGLRLKKVVA